METRSPAEIYEWPVELLWQLRLRPFAREFEPARAAISEKLQKKSDRELIQIHDDCAEADDTNCVNQLFAVAGVVSYEIDLILSSRLGPDWKEDFLDSCI